MWNSTASAITVNSSGYLYSQNHGNTAGSLYIWGAYTRASSGTDYWDYAKDFDGTPLFGSSRQANVHIASSSSVTISTGGSIEMIGNTTGATTTVANQGAGRYSFSVNGGSINAQYYQMRNMDSNGLSLSGTPSITSLSNGDLELDVVSGGSLMTVTVLRTELRCRTYRHVD